MNIAVQKTTSGVGNEDFEVALEQVLGAASEEQEGGAGQTMGRCGGCGGCGHCGCGHCGCGHCGCGHCGCGHCGCGHCGCR